jgi:5-methylcytosine-specific restriction endonuclease McrA
MVRKIILLIVAFLFAIAPLSSIAGPRHSSSGKSSHKSSTHSHSYHSTSSKSYKPVSLPKSAYKSGSTKYYIGETYKTTGLPKVDRSSSAKDKFLKSQSLKAVPSGYEVDHVVPLSKGGADDLSNMQLLPKSVHKVKTSREKEQK